MSHSISESIRSIEHSLKPKRTILLAKIHMRSLKYATLPFFPFLLIIYYQPSSVNDRFVVHLSETKVERGKEIAMFFADFSSHEWQMAMSQ